ALLGDGTVPQREVAVRIVGAAEEDLAAARLALDDLAAVLRAEDAGRLLLDVLAGRIAAARRELAEPALLDDQVRAALRALLVEDLVRLGGGDSLLGGDDLPRRLALGIAGAGEGLADAAALDRHRLAAVLARLLERLRSFGRGLRRLQLAGVLALGIAAAGEEETELAGLDHHRLGALVARDRRIRLHALLEIDHLLGGALQILGELLVEAGQRGLVVGRPRLDLVEILLELARVADIENVVEGGAEQLLDQHHAEDGRLDLPFALVHVLARLDYGDDRRVGGGTPDAVLFERLDQRRLGVARRRLGEFLLRLQLAPRQRVTLGQRRPHARVLVVFRGAGVGSGRDRLDVGRRRNRLVVDRHPAGELRHRALDAEEIRGRGDVDGGFVEGRRRHLRRDETVPDQLVEVVLIVGELRAHLVGVVLHRGRADRFVRVLSIRLRLEEIGLFRHVLVAERAGDELAHFGERLIGDARRGGSHVGDEPDRALAGQLHAFIELLRHHHRLLDGEA